jgi:hypothetical protein
MAFMVHRAGSGRFIVFSLDSLVTTVGMASACVSGPMLYISFFSLSRCFDMMRGIRHTECWSKFNRLYYTAKSL